MRKIFILSAILLQVVILAVMAGEREYILRLGTSIHLRTAPIDPRDLFRGDFVRLNYDISRPAPRQLKGAAAGEIKKGDKVYVSLQEGFNGLYEATQARLQPPKSGLFITGRFQRAHKKLSPGRPIWVRYGIEAYFVEQGTGLLMEKRRGTRTGVQVPLEMEIAVGKSGKAVIKGHRWSQLGIGLQVVRGRQANTRDFEARDSATVRLTLANASDEPLAIVDMPNSCSLALEPVPWAKHQWVPAQNHCDDLLPTDSDVIVLEPREEKSVDLNFADDRWLVTAGGKLSHIGTLEATEQFRLVYRPPPKKDCRKLENRSLIWHGNMPSRVFHGRGRID